MTQDDADFTDGLRAALSDDRFALEPTAGARQSIVAAARTRRRRREAAYVTGGSLAVAGVLLGGFLLVSPPEQATTLAEDAPSQSQPEQAATARMAPAQEPAAPMATGSDRATIQDRRPPVPLDAEGRTLLGPSGYRSLRLGMPYDEVRETGLLADPGAPPPKDCVRYALSNDGAVREVLVSENTGLAALTANEAHTPEGIGVGSTRAELERTYGATEADNPPQYEIPTGPGYYLFRVEGDRVSELTLVANKQDCGLP